MSTLAAIVLSLGMLQAQPAPEGKPIVLARKFTAGERLVYDLKANLFAESRQMGLQTFLPSDLDINSVFTFDVQKLKADGIAQVLFTQPTQTVIEGETAESPPKTTVEKSNTKLQLDISPINGVLNVKDLTPPKPAPKARGGAKSLRVMSAMQQSAGIPIIGQFVQEIYRMSLFLGSLESGLALSPALPFDEVAPGDTWKRTVGYQPQRMSGKTAKTVVQRLDYTYTYEGIKESNGRKVYRVVARLSLDTDAAPLFNRAVVDGSGSPIMKNALLKLDANIEWDLDLETMHTLEGRARSEGSITITLNEAPGEPVIEEKLRGRTNLKLIQHKVP